jgi:hypothetical protein
MDLPLKQRVGVFGTGVKFCGPLASRPAAFSLAICCVMALALCGG